jgi:hypothetical protein
MWMIKGDVLFLPRDAFVTSASMMPEAPVAPHGYSTPLGQWVVCRFLGGKRISDHCLPVTLQSSKEIRMTLCQMALHLATSTDDDDRSNAPARLSVLVHPL